MNADEVAADLARLAETSVAAVVNVVGKEVLTIEADVKKRAARPRTAPSVAGLGPRLQTGDYNRSIGSRVRQLATKVEGSVGTDKVQGYRLEKGFDAPGQRTLPHPHFGPALDASEDRFGDAVEAAILGAIK